MNVNIYQTLYDLLNTYVYGGTVLPDTYQDLVLIGFSTFATLFVMSLPFLVCWHLVKFVSRW
jgi:hypothetical protein